MIVKKLRIKVCGMKFKENITSLISTNVDFMGIIFYSSSKRYINPNEGSHFIKSVKIKKVGVFVNESVENIIELSRIYDLDYIQLHGYGDISLCSKLQNNYLNVIRAFLINSIDDFQDIYQFKSCSDFFLFDYKSGTYGGSGKSFDWSYLKDLSINHPYFLSGGISFSDIKKINFLRDNNKHLFGVDINSCFEERTGLKNIKLVSQFIKEINYGL